MNKEVSMCPGMEIGTEIILEQMLAVEMKIHKISFKEFRQTI